MYPGTVCRHVGLAVGFAVAVPDTTVVAPDSATAIADTEGIQDRGIR